MEDKQEGIPGGGTETVLGKCKIFKFNMVGYGNIFSCLYSLVKDLFK